MRNSNIPPLDTYKNNLVEKNGVVYFRWEGHYYNQQSLQEQVTLLTAAKVFARNHDRKNYQNILDELAFWMGARSATYIKQKQTFRSIAS